MKNSKIIFSILFTLFISLSFASRPIKGNGINTQQEITVDYFSKLSVDGMFDVQIEQGETQEVKISTDENIIKHVKAEVIDGELTITLSKPTKNIDKIALMITVTDISVINLSGAASLYSDVVISAENLTITTIETAKAQLEVATKELYIQSSGTSQLILAGTTDDLSVVTTATSYFDGLSLETADCTASAEDVSSIRINVKNNLSVLALGNSMVSFKGNPTIEDMTVGRDSKFNML
ncbi:MAG: head GIN domain-containing protein [Chitinophagales bacterium]